MSATIIPAIVPYVKEQVQKQMSEIREFSSNLQLDITDGIFTSKESLQAKDFSKSDFLGITLEVHLMVAEPEKIITDWIRLGAQRIVIPVEASPSAQLLQSLEHQGVIPVIGCSAPTPLVRLEPYAHIVHSYLFLTIDPPGSQGLVFLHEALQKMMQFHKQYPAFTFAVDGGANSKTIPDIVAAGAKRIIVGSALQEKGQFINEKFRGLQALASE